MFKSLDEAKDRCWGFLLGTAIGDAMGVPFEGLPPLKNISEEELFSDFVALPNKSFPLGTVSDDTQFTALTMLSLHLNDGFDPEHLAEIFCQEFKKNRTEGWGLSTYHAIARMVYNGISWDSCGAPVGSAGNGAAMRSGPFGLFPFESKGEMIKATIQSSKITHTDPDACSGVIAIAEAHRYLRNCESFNRDDFCNAVLEAVKTHSRKLSDLLSTVFSSADLGDILVELSLIGDGPENPETGKRGISAYVLPSMAAALSIFLAFPKDPPKALRRAILAGGDTDTVGSIVGGLIGTLNGAGIWPDHLATNVQDYGNLLIIADSFAKTCWEIYSP